MSHRRFPQSGLYTFTGENGTLGYITGGKYYLSVSIVRRKGEHHVWVTAPTQCPYDNVDLFWENWDKVNHQLPIRSSAS